MDTKSLARGLLIAFLALSIRPALAADELIFSAPPRGTAEEETPIYRPIAEYLSAVTGRQIVYRHPDNWLGYQRGMQRGKFDLVFDGPHFVAWRMAMVGHEPLVRLPGKLIFVVIVRDEPQSPAALEGLIGRKFCALPPPNLATLTVQAQFPNPMRQPVIVPTRSFRQSYEGVKSGRCVAAVLRDKMLKKFKVQGVKVIFTSAGVANQAFSAGPRFNEQDKKRIAEAILSPDGIKKMDAFHARFNKKRKQLVKASVKEYDGLWVLLKDVWGFEVKQSARIAGR